MIQLDASVALLLLIGLNHLVSAQNCYFPNGNLDTQGLSTSCSSEGGACCPLNWECLSNGLCYDPAAKYYGRYTCTDQSWSADSDCPQYCTQNGTAAGNEAISDCSDGSWCCDGDRVHVDCCADSDPAAVLDISSFSVVNSITSAWTPTPDGSSSTAAPSTSSSTTPSITSTTSTSPTFLTGTESPTIFTTASATTDAAGIASTIIIVQTEAPASVTPAEKSSGSDNTPLIIGMAVGIPVFLIAAFILAYMLYRRHRCGTAHLNEKSSFPSTGSDTIDMYKPNHNTPEIDSFPVAISGNKPGHKSQISELSAGNYPPQHSGSQGPAVSSITTKRDSGLPQYSPVSLLNHHTSTASAPAHLPQVQEENTGPVELWGSLPPASQPQDFAPTVIPAERASVGAFPGYAPYSPSPESTAANRASHLAPASATPAPIAIGNAPYRQIDELHGALGSPPPGDQDRGQLGSGPELRAVNH